jgi:Mg-chelatase subunit ChlI
MTDSQLAVVLCAIDPQIGGVLFRGPGSPAPALASLGRQLNRCLVSADVPDASGLCAYLPTDLPRADARLRLRIGRARRNVARVSINPLLVTRIADLCAALNLEGPGPALAIVRGAKALAALDGRLRVAVDDIRRVAPLALGHRVADPSAIGPGFDRILAGGLDKTA